MQVLMTGATGLGILSAGAVARTRAHRPGAGRAAKSSSICKDSAAIKS